MSLTRDSAIGVFDSGIGGLTVLHQIIEALPREKPFTWVTRRGRRTGPSQWKPSCATRYENSEFLVEKGVKTGSRRLQHFDGHSSQPLQESLPVPVIGVIEPGVRRAIKSTKNKKVGVIGTEATIQSGAYTRRFESGRPEDRSLQPGLPVLCSAGRGRLDG